MKRIKSACLLQTVHFELKEDIAHDAAVSLAKQEYEHYKALLERNRTKYRITEEKTEPDGSISIRIRKQYNSSPLGDYLED